MLGGLAVGGLGLGVGLGLYASLDGLALLDAVLLLAVVAQDAHELGVE